MKNKSTKAKIALITGVTGQDGSYLAEFLLEKGYIVHGIKRRASLFNTDRVDHIYQDPHVKNTHFKLHYGDLTDTSNLVRILQETQPDEIYNLAAQSHVAVSFESPEYTADVVGTGTLRLLEAYAYWIVVNYREAYGMYACNGILFNHESPRRGETFVTRKITRGLANITQGLDDCLYMGNIDALRDWGHAKDYVRMQWMMLQQEQPDDFVIATGKQYSVRQFIEMSATELGINIKWQGSGVDETGVIDESSPILNTEQKILKTGDTIFRIDPCYFRPTEVESLLGDPTKAKEKLGWVPEITLQEMCKEMVEHDLKQAKQHALLKKHGFSVNISTE